MYLCLSPLSITTFLIGYILYSNQSINDSSLTSRATTQIYSVYSDEGVRKPLKKLEKNIWAFFTLKNDSKQVINYPNSW